MDILSCLIYKGVEGGIVEPFKVGSKEVALSHLQFHTFKEIRSLSPLGFLGLRPIGKQKWPPFYP